MRWTATLFEQDGRGSYGQNLTDYDFDWKVLERHYFDSEKEAVAYKASRLTPQHYSREARGKSLVWEVREALPRPLF